MQPSQPPKARRGLAGRLPRSLRGQLAFAFLVPSLLAIAALVTLSYFASRALIEDEVGHRLQDVAATAVAGLNPGLVARFKPENHRTHENLLKRLRRAATQAGARRVFLVTPSGHAIADTAEDAPAPGTLDRTLAEDRFELEQVAQGIATASVLYTGLDGVRYKRGFAPVIHEEQVVAVLGVESSTGGFAALDRLGTYLVGISVFALALLAFAVFTVGRALTAPLRKLSAAAQAIGQGDLEAPVPVVGQANEVAVLARTMDEMRDALRRRDRELQMMLGGIAHEVRNPLGGMELFVGLLEEDLYGRDDELELLGRVKKELGQLKRVVEEFLAYARRAPIERADINLGDLVFELSMGAPDIKVVLDGPYEATISADGDQLRRLLLNLVRNACQAGAKHVSITPTAEGVCVTDDGPGIPAEQAEQVFDAFYTTRQKGTGLGLALCRRIAETHGGTLTLDNPGDPGACFVVVLTRR
jgi:signal transduction histidine kinase